MNHFVDTAIRPIGGFFGLALHDIPKVADSIWQNWLDQGRLALTAWTARAALRALIEAVAPERAWLPSYMCRDVAAVVPSPQLRFYPVDQTLAPDLAVLRRVVFPGDLVLAVDFFGWTPAQSFLDFVRQRPDVVWVEDRTQCLWTNQPAWGDWRLYSPRKLVGVADGGVLIASAERAHLELRAKGSEAADPDFAMPALMRFEDGDETHNAAWYAAFKEREARLSGEFRPMSRLTAALLQRIPLPPLVAARRRNFAFLQDRLADLQAWDRSPADVAPFGFPIAVDDADALGAALAAERLFCSRHWPPSVIAAPETDFPVAHALARQLITLPCDHRYDESRLERLAAAVRRLAAPAERGPAEAARAG